MNVKVVIKIGLFVLMLAFLSACSSQSYYFSERKWQVSVVMPSLYPVSVTQAYGINDSEGWTVLVHNFTQFMSTSELNYVREKLPNYDGFGLPLHSISIIRRNQIGGTNHFPDTIYIYWVSLVNTKFYVTKYELDKSVKELMATRGSFQRENGFVVKNCYRNEIIFGLLPDGRAKVWLEGCGETIYVKELPPDRILGHDSNGKRVEDYKNSSLFNDVKKRAEDEGVSTDPIPWDRVNKVYTLEKVKSLDEALTAIHQ